jgi:branched-chain amino acid transport system ATP-binding protein
MTAVLELHDATVRYGGVTAVDALSLQHVSGGIIGLIGPNGAGKTTLLNALSGVSRLTSGRIRFGGRDVTRLRPAQVARLGVTRTFQNLQVFDSLTVLENVLVPRLARGWGAAVAEMVGLPAARRRGRADTARAHELLALVGLTGHAGTLAGTLPYGLQRRVEIARALAGDPSLLLLDEPLAGLSRSESTDLTELFRRVAGDGVTVLLVEHDVASVLAVSQRVVVLDHGSLLADGTPEKVAADPSVRAAYLGEDWDE